MTSHLRLGLFSTVKGVLIPLVGEGSTNIQLPLLVFLQVKSTLLKKKKKKPF